jgi:hypothetical protein
MPQTLWVGFANNTIGISNSATGNPSPTYIVHEAGLGGTVTFTPRNPVTAVTGVDVKSNQNGSSVGWVTAAAGTDGQSITEPAGVPAGTTYYYAVSVTRSGFTGTDTLDPLWQND